MSRKVSTGSIVGIVVALVVVGLWPGSDSSEPALPGDSAGVAPSTTLKTPSASPPELQAVTNGAQASPVPELRDFHVFGESVQFLPGDRCDDHGNCRLEPVPLHAYAEYSDEQLRTLAVFDGLAAIVLANRLGASDPEQARHYAARGFVLTGDPYAFHMTRQFSGVETGARYDSDGRFDLRAAQQAYIWIKTGYELGVSDGASLAYQASVLNENGFTDLERLDSLADATRRKVEQARLELVGEGFE